MSKNTVQEIVYLSVSLSKW